MKQFFGELKKELQQYKIDLPKDEKTGEITSRSQADEYGFINKDFFVTLHTIIYKYKKYGQDMLSDANFRERIVFLEQIEEIKEFKEDTSEEGKQQIAELNEMYTKLV